MLTVALPIGSLHGWGVVGRSLTLALAEKTGVCLVTDDFDLLAAGDEATHRRLAALRTTSPGFGPLLSVMLDNASVRLWKPELLGSPCATYFVFEETTLTPTMVERARDAGDLLLTASTWCEAILREHGVTAVRTVLHGIDPILFSSTIGFKQHWHDRFVVFSGGKFEYRKGQDIALRAVQILQDRYDDVFFAVAWETLGDFSRSMAASPHITITATTTRGILAENGIDLDRSMVYPLTPHHEMAAVYRDSDVGLFPNRCEGASNLVLMEYMACGRPVIASYTSGHQDVLADFNARLIRSLNPIAVTHNERPSVWDEPSLEETVNHLNWAYHHRADLIPLATRAARDLAQFSWPFAASQILRAMELSA